MKNTFSSKELCPKIRVSAKQASDCDVLSNCRIDKENPKKCIWSLSFAQSVIDSVGFKPGETLIAFDYHDGFVTFYADDSGRLLSKPHNSSVRPRLRFALPVTHKGFIDRGASPVAIVDGGRITIEML